MLVSYKWICELAGIDATPQELSDRLTFCGLEVEGLDHRGANLGKIVVAEIKSKEPHPKRDKLSIVEVDSGGAIHNVVCGAPNCPGPGGRVVLAMTGAKVGEITIEPRKLAGVPSEGMLCSEAELDLGPDDDGIMILGGLTDAPIGTPIVEALDLEDWIMDVGITPNRPDAISHRGVARDAALLFNKPFSPPVLEKAPEGGDAVEKLATVELLASDACPRYGAAVVTGVEVKPSPFSVRYRLHTLGIRPISNLVDVTNIVMLEFGQPLHAFDLDEVNDAKIIVRKACEGEKMVTLDGEERTLDAHDLLICDGERPVALAGVMGGLNTEITEKTKNVLIECAYFAPKGVRRTAKRVKLSSESSYRFERGIDPGMGPAVLESTSGLMIELGGGVKAPGLIDCYPTPIQPIGVHLRTARFKTLMGFDVPVDEMERILVGLGAETKQIPEGLEVSVPTSRPDIEREVDLIEEVARIRGLEEVKSTLPSIRCTMPERPHFEAARRAKETLASLGLVETINYSFVPKEMLALLGMDDKAVQIANPLNAERKTMRTTLVVGLLESLKRASSRSLAGLSQFEVGQTFHDQGEELPKEVMRAAAILSGPAPGWIGESRQLDFFDVKGVVEAFVLEFSRNKPVLEPVSDLPWLHPRKACRVLVDGVQVGCFGELHPQILTNLKLPTGACVLELSVMELWERRKNSMALPVPAFPSMGRDIALLVAEEVDAGPIIDALYAQCGALATEIALFDVYQGKGIADGKKSLAFSIVYRAPDRTLTDEEVDKVHNAAVEKVASQFNAQQR